MSQHGAWIKQTQLNASDFTAVQAPIACNGFMCENSDTSNGMSIRSDPNDPTTEMTVPAGGWFGITANYLGAGNTRWVPTETIFYAKLLGGTGSLVVVYIN